MNKSINIHIEAHSDLSGISKMSCDLKGLGEVAGKVSEAFGRATTYVGQFFKNLLRGGIWQGGAAVPGFLTKKVIEFWKSSEEEAKEFPWGQPPTSLVHTFPHPTPHAHS